MSSGFDINKALQQASERLDQKLKPVADKEPSSDNEDLREVKPVAEPEDRIEPEREKESNLTYQPAPGPRYGPDAGETTKKPAARPVIASDPNKLVTVKELPVSVITACRQEFPEINKYADLIQAYVYMKSGKGFDVPREIREIVSVHEKDGSSVEQVIDSQRSLLKKLDAMADKINVLEMCLVYLLYDRLGFRSERPDDPGSVDFLEPGFYELLTRTESTGKRLKTELQYKNGRPKS